MAQRKGQISVDTQDIFPIIKKWLYSEHDIFIRELVSNATDAITKRSTLGRTQNQEIPEGQILVDVDKKAKTIKVSDNGIGMTEDEIEKYIAKLAFSGAEEFIEKLKKEGADKGSDIIGKFGLGFYSSFMVAHKVEIDSLSMTEGASPTKWICEGDTEYEFMSSDRKSVGTTITLHINEDSEEFLSAWSLRSTLKKFCDFMPYPITVDDVEEREERQKAKEEDKKPAPEVINDTRPLWREDPKELEDKDYLEFYRRLYPMEQDPLFWIHLKVDHPFTLEGILYFPKFNPARPVKENNIKLYNKQVYVSNNLKDVLPDFLVLLQGAIDSSDIPLNVSRSSLQGDPNIKRISNYVVKKVAEALTKLAKNDREKYESIWPDAGLFVKYGCVSDGKFDELMRKHVIFKNYDGNFLTFNEYKDAVPKDYQEKLQDKILYFEQGKSDWSVKEQLKQEKIPFFETDDHLDPHFMQHCETKPQGEEKLIFSSIDTEVENIFGEENTTEDDVKIKDLFKQILTPDADTKKDDDTVSEAMEIEVKRIKSAQMPAYFRIDEQMKRFAQMAKSMGQNQSFPVKKTLIINPANSLIQNALKLWEKDQKDLAKSLCQYVEDLASIAHEGLQDDKRDHFVQRSQNLMEQLTGKML